MGWWLRSSLGIKTFGPLRSMCVLLLEVPMPFAGPFITGPVILLGNGSINFYSDFIYMFYNNNLLNDQIK